MTIATAAPLVEKTTGLENGCGQLTTKAIDFGRCPVVRPVRSLVLFLGRNVLLLFSVEVFVNQLRM